MNSCLKIFIALLAPLATVSMAAAPVESMAPARNMSAQQQPKNLSVKGLVVDQDGVPVIGAAVMIKGNKSNGAVTDIDGRFVIKAPAGSVLEISCLGYTYKTVTLASAKDLRIIMEEESTML